MVSSAGFSLIVERVSLAIGSSPVRFSCPKNIEKLSEELWTGIGVSASDMASESC